MISELSTEQIASVGRLYSAYFKRIPDADGLNYWLGQLDTGMSIDEMSARFYDSSEFVALYGEPTNGGYIDSMYQNIFDREPDADGREYWIERLDEGASRFRVLLEISDSQEFRGNTAEYFDTLQFIEEQWTFDPIPDGLPSILEGVSPNILNLTFDEEPVGPITESDLDAYLAFDGVESDSTNVDGYAEIVSNNGDGAINVTFLEGLHKNGLQFYLYLQEPEEVSKELYFSYKVEFSEGFDFGKGIKLPGVGGIPGSRDDEFENPTGKRDVGIDDGFSYRLMARGESGVAEQYIYNQYVNEDKRPFSVYGHSVNFIPGKEYQIDQAVIMNDAGQSNGSITTWINGVMVFHENNLSLSHSGTYGANKIFVDLWHGGDNDDWGPGQDVQALLDDIFLSTIPIMDGLTIPVSEDVNTVSEEIMLIAPVVMIDPFGS
jgi:hypothetical protein